MKHLCIIFTTFAPNHTAGLPSLDSRWGTFDLLPPPGKILRAPMYGITIWTDLSPVLLQCTRLTDRQTDRILIARPRLHSMQRGKNYNQ